MNIKRNHSYRGAHTLQRVNQLESLVTLVIYLTDLLIIQYYFAIPVSGQAKNIKLAKTQNDALNGTALTINEKGGVLKVVSRVSDKNAGDIGHPVQYDTTNTQWYVKVGTDLLITPSTQPLYLLVY